MTLALLDLADAAANALTGGRWAITEAANTVPARPGLYTIYGDETARRQLELPSEVDAPLYVGKAERSLVSRDLNGHFAVLPDSAARTGSSTVRRSFAALLRETLQLQAVPRNPDNPGHFSNYGLAAGGDDRLTRWMHDRLFLAVWEAPEGMPVTRTEVETAVIRRYTPLSTWQKIPANWRA